MKHWILLITLFIFNLAGYARQTRLIVSTDIGGSDPDDQESLVHLLISLDQVDLEGLIFQHAWVPINEGNEFKVVDKVLTAYRKAWNNLNVHSQGFPKEEEIREKLKYGQRIAGMKGVGKGMDTPGSEHIIKIVDMPDERPVWIAAWSGVNTLAQALWKVKATRSSDEVAKFVSKLRVYDVLGQDDAGAWIATNFPDLLYIRNTEVYGWGPDDNWIKENVQNRGVMGLVYPDRIWASEGDSPSFMYVLENGLNYPEHIDWGGWGGRFDLQPVIGIRSMEWVAKSGLDETIYDPYYMIASSPERNSAINRWRIDILNDFAARMQWTSCSSYSGANHHPIIPYQNDTSKDAVCLSANPGETLHFDATDSYDPDGNSLAYEWIYYQEPSTYKKALDLQAKNSKMSFIIPKDAGNSTIHIILRVTDDGFPALSSYKRFIINVSD
jgi:hypothetical protein